jgi:hypothetical protein
MSMGVEAIRRERAFSFGHVPAWFWLGAGIYVLLLVNGSSLLNDSDTYWQIAAGKWILDHNAFPRVDIYSFTKTGEPWISTSWLAQILYAITYELAGWTGPIVLAATSIAATFALLAFILARRIPSPYATTITLAALVLSTGHLLARPHVLVMPVLVAWVYGLAARLRGQQRGGTCSYSSLTTDREAGSPKSSMQMAERNQSLDLLRGAAILMVLLAHCAQGDDEHRSAPGILFLIGACLCSAREDSWVAQIVILFAISFAVLAWNVMMPIMTLLGRHSYGIYLTHFGWASAITALVSLDLIPMFMLVTAASLGGSYYLIEPLFERRFNRLGHLLALRAGRPKTAANAA